MKRRFFMTAIAGAVATPSLFSRNMAIARSLSPARAGRSYRAFLSDIRAEALDRGLSANVVDAALSLSPRPNQAVLKRDRHQPEFSMTWAQYRARVLGAVRLQQAAMHYQNVRNTLEPVAASFGADDSVVMGIWGLESNFGTTQGRYHVVDALATLAFDGRRASFFKSELFNALKILVAGDVTPEAMLGSYAGAMGQPQFMPSAYLRYAADGDGDGRRDIWNAQPDVFASIAHYLTAQGWQRGRRWGQEVQVPLGMSRHFVAMGVKASRHAQKRSVAQWTSMGVRPLDGQSLEAPAVMASLIQPDGIGGQAFLVYRNFHAIRAYNPSDYYALAVGLLGDAAVPLANGQRTNG